MTVLPFIMTEETQHGEKVQIACHYTFNRVVQQSRALKDEARALAFLFFFQRFIMVKRHGRSNAKAVLHKAFEMKGEIHHFVCVKERHHPASGATCFQTRKTNGARERDSIWTIKNTMLVKTVHKENEF